MNSSELRGYLKACIDAYQTTYEIPEIIKSIDNEISSLQGQYPSDGIISETDKNNNIQSIKDRYNKEYYDFKISLERSRKELSELETKYDKLVKEKDSKVQIIEEKYDKLIAENAGSKNDHLVNRDLSPSDILNTRENRYIFYDCLAKLIEKDKSFPKELKYVSYYIENSYNKFSIPKKLSYPELTLKLCEELRKKNNSFWYLEGDKLTNTSLNYKDERERKCHRSVYCIPLSYLIKMKTIWNNAIKEAKSKEVKFEEKTEHTLKEKKLNELAKIDQELSSLKYLIQSFKEDHGEIVVDEEDLIKLKSELNEECNIEINNYNEFVLSHNEEVSKIISELDTKSKILKLEKKGFEDNLQVANKTLENLLSYNIHEKYRSYPCICKFYDLIDTERCTELTGPFGAYQRYEEEKRADDHEKEERLFREKIFASLSTISENQKVLAYAIAESEKRIEQTIHQLGDNISFSISNMKASFQDNLNRTVSELGGRISEISSNQQSINQTINNTNSLLNDYKENSEATRYNTERIKKIVDFDSHVKYVNGEFRGFEYTYPY